MCGIIGIAGVNEVNTRIYDALTVMQHRGQDAAGIMTDADGVLCQRKDEGMVRDVFHTRHMKRLFGTFGIGHVRYPTAGSSGPALSQPFYVNSPYGISMAHNGNLTNSEQLREEIFRVERRHLSTDSDSEILLNVFANEMSIQNVDAVTASEVFATVSRVHARCRGAYAVVGLIANQGLFAFRDPFGIRPLVYGKMKTAEGIEYAVASESEALEILGFTVVADLKPGEALWVNKAGQLHIRQCAEDPKLVPCLFEFVYFARPDAIIDGISVYKARLSMGRKLAERVKREWADHDIDVVVPVPDTSRVAAQAMAENLGVPLREGFMKNRYVGRTFIMPGQTQRKKSVRQKLNPVKVEIEGKNVMLVDDSIVRGTTSREIVQMVRDAGANKVYFASAAPPVRYPNVYGIDMPSANELIAHSRTDSEVEKYIGVDRLIYQNIDDLLAAVRENGSGVSEFESAVFTGSYVTGDIDTHYLDRLDAARNDDVKAGQKQFRLALGAAVKGIHDGAANG